MAEPRLTNILISIVFVGLIAVAFSQFLGAGASNYSLEGYTNSSLQVYIDSTSSIENITTNTSSKLDEAGAKDDGLFDIIGAFFSGAWTALKTTSSSIGVLQVIASDSVGKLPFINSTFSATLTSFLLVSIVIIIVIGIFIHFFKPSNRL